jgi:hypothetical protein
VGADHGFQAGVNVEALHDPADVIPHGLGRDAEGSGNALGRVARSEVAEDIHLPRCEMRAFPRCWERFVGRIGETEHADDRVALEQLRRADVDWNIATVCASKDDPSLRALLGPEHVGRKLLPANVKYSGATICPIFRPRRSPKWRTAAAFIHRTVPLRSRMYAGTLSLAIDGARSGAIRRSSSMLSASTTMK